MTTQYTPTLKLALPVTGELSGTWGDVVNDNITSMIEQAIAGLSTINTWTGNAHTLTTANGTTSESRCAMLVAATGSGGSAITGAGEIICPAAAKLYVLQNTTAFAITLKTSAGSGVAVASGNTAFLFCDGTNVNSCVTTIVDGNITGNLTVGGNATINGNTTLGNATSDTITATARFASDLVPSTDNARDLGSSANSWRSLWIDGTATMALVAISGGTIDGVSIGATTAATLINVDNLRLDGNTLSSTDTNGNVVIAPNGTGDVQLDADTVRVGDSGAAATLTSNGAGALTVTTGGAADLTLSTNAGTDSGTVVIANGANGNITLTPNGTGDVILSADRVQIGDSNTDTTLTTNGTGSLNLSTNNGTNSGTIQIAQGANGNITLTPNGTGFVALSKLSVSDTSTLVKTLTLGNTSFNGAAVFAPATPAKLYIGTGTVTDTTSAASATNATGAVNSLAITPIAATNASVTYTNASTLYIAGAPSAGTNVTITNPYSLYVAAGDAYFGGTVTAGTVNLTTLDLTNLEVTNIKAKDGTASITLADTTGIATFSGATVFTAGTALLPAITTTGDTNTGIWFPAADTIAFTEGGVESMRIDSAGTLLVGMTTDTGVGVAVFPTGITRKNTNGTVFDQYRYAGTSVGTTTTDGANIQYNAASSLVFGTNGSTERMRITSAGSVAIGTTSAISTLTVNGTDGITMQRSTANAFAPVLDYLKSRGTTASPAGVSDGDGLFLLRVAPYNGSAFTYLNSMTIEVDGGYTAGQNPPTRQIFYTNAANGTSTNRLTILSNGNVGIGASSPSQTLEVNGGAAIVGTTPLYMRRPAIPSFAGQGAPSIEWQFYTTGTTYTTGAYIQALADAAWSSTSAPTSLRFYTVPSGSITPIESMRNDASGMFLDTGTGGGRMTFSPGATRNQILSTTTGFGAYNILRNQASAYEWLNTSSTQVMTLTGAGNLGIGQTNPQSALGFGTVATITWGTTNYPYISADQGVNSISFGTQATERVRLDSGGNFAIGNGVTTSNTIAGAMYLGNFGTVTGSGISIGGAYVASVSGSPWYTSTSLAFATNPGPDVTATGAVERMRISGAGNVGIDETAPTSRLHVALTSNSVDNILQLQQKGNNTASGITLAANDNNGAGYNFIRSLTTGGTTHWAINGGVTTSTMAFSTGGSERARINGSGQLLVGCTAFPSSTVPGTAIFLNGPNGGAITIANNQTGGFQYVMNFINGNGDVGRIDTSGSSTNYVTTSDARTKEDLGVATSTNVIKDTVVHDFIWKSTGEKARGMFAQEAYLVNPSAVSKGKSDELDGKGNPKHPWGVDYSKYVPDIIVELQSLRAEFDAYKASHP